MGQRHEESDQQQMFCSPLLSHGNEFAKTRETTLRTQTCHERDNKAQ